MPTKKITKTSTPNQVTTEVTTSDTSTEDKPYLLAVQIVDLIHVVINGSLLMRFILRLAGANSGTGFVRLTYNFTDVLMAPFAYVFPQLEVGQYVFEWSILLAMIIYALLMMFVRKLVATAYVADKG